jgi:hypothetical protein
MVEALLNTKNVIYYCIDDPNLSYKGVKGKSSVDAYILKIISVW